MSKTNKIEQKKKALIEALEKTLGVVTTACKSVGISRTMFYQYLKDDPEFAEQVRMIEDVALDFVESQNFKLIREGNPSAIIFYLKTKGKKRGFTERQEMTGADGAPLNIDIEVYGSSSPITDEPEYED